MRIQLVVDGEKQELEVDLAHGEARLGGRAVPFRIVDDAGTKAELEIQGERFVVEGWPAPEASPPNRTLVVNREVHRVEVSSVDVARGAGRSQLPASGLPLPTGKAPPSPASAGAQGPGVAITPPMPGKVLEVRVKEGEMVAAGQTLLVLEAMKMRNEVQSPAAGKVAHLVAVPGAMVKAREVLLRVLPA